MNNDTFYKVIYDLINVVDVTLHKKGEEYSLADDRLSAFKEAAKIFQITPEQVLFGYCMKHIMSVKDMIDSYKDFEFSIEIWVEKLCDIINYMLILYAMKVEERMSKDEDQN